MKVWLVTTLLVSAALAESWHDEEPSAYEEEQRRWARLDEGPAYERDSCCRYEDSRRGKRSTRRLPRYEVHEDTGDEPQWTAPMFGSYAEDIAGAASDQRPRTLYPDEHYHRPSEPAAPSPARYSEPAAPSSARYLEPSAPSPARYSEPAAPSLARYSEPAAPLPARYSEPAAPSPARYSEPTLEAVQTDEADEADQDPEGTFLHHRKTHSGGHSAGGGHGHHGQNHASNGAKTASGHKSSEHSDKSLLGHKTKDLHSKEYEESQGKKKQHRDNAGHEGHHEEEAHGHKGAKFDEKKGHKKGHKTKGYHNKYHKDEFHKEHKFYDDYHKGGSHHRYGKFHAKHASNESGRKKAHHVDAAHDATHKGTKGFSNKGHVDSDHRGHKSKQGHEDHHHHQQHYGKKGGNSGGSKYAYKKN